MRLTDDRYATERSQFELALRMIGHEARTHIIRECTGLSDDRIRKLYGTYFQNAAFRHIKRRRGKSPQQVSRFVRNPQHQLQATTLIALFCSGLILRLDTDRRAHCCWPRPDVDYGHRVCRAFETYLILHPDAKLNFEWAWHLLRTIAANDELYLADCDSCHTAYVQDSYALDHKCCPSCEISRQSRQGRA